MTRFYGLKPWEIEEMTYGEIGGYLRFLSDVNHAGDEIQHEDEVAEQRRKQREILGLPDPPKFRSAF